MEDSAQELLQTMLDEAHLPLFAQRLVQWLLADLGQDQPDPVDFPDSRAKALLRAAEVVDNPTLHSFNRLINGKSAGSATAVRLALYDLLQESSLAEVEAVISLAATSMASAVPESTPPVPWLALAVAAYAWSSQYPLRQLDPASPPETYSPAGQVVRQAGQFVRRQVQRSATERDKLAKQVAYQPSAARAPSLDQLSAQDTAAPLPPHYRPPVPVRYAEVAGDTLHVEPEDEPASPPVVRTDPVTVSSDEVNESTPQRMPPIRITADQIPAPRRSRVVTPPASPPPLASFTNAVRQKFGRSREQFVSTRLRVLVQEIADGPGLYGVQVRISCRGVNSYVAGTSNREWEFLCSLPVRVRSGLTYDVDVTWPRDMSGEVERKSITLNGDRTEFQLPFYRRIQAA